MVARDGLVDKLDVRADGTGMVGHAGSALIVVRFADDGVPRAWRGSLM